MKLGFYGGVGEVTGSRHLLEGEGARLLLDCGLFQGHRREAIDKNRSFPFKAPDVDAVLLSHAHIDHSGNLPLLAKAGFRGPIHCTAATRDLCGVMLLDSAHLQEEDAKFFNKIHQADGQRIEPLYTAEDAERALALFRPHEYDAPIPLGGDATARLLNAGHVLGSAMVFVEAGAGGKKRRLLFTGDLGRRRSVLMRPPAAPRNVDYLIIESTYGGRSHEPIEKTEERLAAIVTRTVKEKGRLLIPSFALERAQEIAFLLGKLRRERAIPDVPLYVDSPMAAHITEIFGGHLDSPGFDPAFKAYAEKTGAPFGELRTVRSPEESKRLNDMPGPMVVISASGMCEGGRVLHHLRNHIGKDNTTVLIVGYQAEGTLGRRLADGAKKVRIFGLMHDVWARVELLQTLSAHADREDLVAFVRALEPRPRQIFLVHGDPEDRAALSEALRAAGVDRAVLPEFGETYALD